MEWYLSYNNIFPMRQVLLRCLPIGKKLPDKRRRTIANDELLFSTMFVQCSANFATVNYILREFFVRQGGTPIGHR